MANIDPDRLAPHAIIHINDSSPGPLVPSSGASGNEGANYDAWAFTSIVLEVLAAALGLVLVIVAIIVAIRRRRNGEADADDGGAIRQGFALLAMILAIAREVRRR